MYRLQIFEFITMTKLLIVEDDLRIAKLVSRFLLAEGFDVEHVVDGGEATAAILNSAPDLVILDMMLPNKDGIEICSEVRREYTNPILMLTAHDDDLNHVLALNSGIDDYLSKPIKPDILLARINALLRRSASICSSSIQIQDLAIDHAKRTVARNGRNIELTDSDFELLWVLAKNAGSILNRDQIFNQVMDVEFNGSDRSIDMRISKLRKKLEDDAQPYQYIKTIRGRGYVFIKEASE